MFFHHRRRRATARSLFWTLVVLTVVCAIGGTATMYITLTEHAQAASYPEAQCTILNKKVQESYTTSKKGQRNYKYKPILTYTILLSDGRSFQGSGYDVTNSTTSSYTTANEIINQFQVGQTYPCWYDPNNPSHAILNRDLDNPIASSTMIVSYGMLGFAGLMIAGAIAVWLYSRSKRNSAASQPYIPQTPFYTNYNNQPPSHPDQPQPPYNQPYS